MKLSYKLGCTIIACLTGVFGSACVVQAQSCPNFLDEPLTKARLNEIARSRGIINNRDIGLAFQDFALGTIRPSNPIRENTKRFPSEERSAATGGRFQNVVPDGVLTLVFRSPGQPDRPFPESVFYEVKAVGGTLYSSSPFDPVTREGTYQILGFLDALENSPSGVAGVGVPAILFLTTADTRISFIVKADAFFKRVAVWQSIACETTGPSDSNLQLGEAEPLNPAVYSIRGTAPGPIGPGARGTIRRR